MSPDRLKESVSGQNNENVQTEEIDLSDQPANEIQKPLFTFAIGGDVMFDRAVDYAFRGDKIFHIFDNFSPNVFADQDLSLINLEGPISQNEIPADNTYNNLIFNFPPKSGETLLGLGIDAVSLANNHSLNNGRSGLDFTKEHLDLIGIVPIGQQKGFNKESIKRFNGNEYTVSIIAIDCLEDDCYSISESISLENSETNFQVVFPHWGEEYAVKHSASQQKIAENWIDAGADLVIGSHPHVIQDALIYKDKPVFFSLGNLLFDQTFSKETQEGFVVSGEIWHDSVKIRLYPTKSIKLTPNFLVGKEKVDFSTKYYQYFNQVYNGQENNWLIFPL